MSALREILARFSIDVDSKPLHEASEGLDGMIEKVKSFAAAAGAAFAVKEIFEFAHGMAEAAVEVEHSAAAFGLSTHEMQEWHLAAKASGVSAEELDVSFKMLAKNVGNGMGPAVDALRKLGVNVKDSSGQIRPLGDLYEEAGGKIGQIENAGKRAAVGQDVFGRQFIKILPLLERGSEGMAELRGKLDELGGGFDEAFIEKSKEVEEQSAFLGQSWTSLKVNIAAFLLPAVKWLTVEGTKLVVMLIDVAKNSEAVHAAMALLAIGGIAALSSLIGPLGAAFGTLLTTVLPLVAAFLLIEDFFSFLKGDDSLIGRAIDGAFGEGAAEKVRQWFISVGKDLSNIQQDFEDLGLYAKVLWNMFLNAGLYAAAYLSDAMDGLWAMMQKGAMYAGAYMSDAFDNAWDSIIDGAKAAIGYIAKIPGLGDLGKDLDLLDGAKNRGHAVKDLDELGTGTSAGHAVADLDAIVAREQQAFVAQYDKIHNVQTVQGGDVSVHVTVPPGTPETLANRVGSAAAEGAQRGAQTARGTHAALVPGSL